MESLNNKVQSLFDNKHKYKDQEYINIMNELKLQYNKLNNIKEEAIILHLNIVEEEEEEEEEEIDYDSDGNENYFSSY
jgi:hypothetical protein